MAKISYYSDGVPKPSNLTELRLLAKQVCQGEKLKGSITVVFTGDDSLRQLNLEYRNLNKTTDVLSFPFIDLKPAEKRKKETTRIESPLNSQAQRNLCVSRTKQEPLPASAIFIGEIYINTQKAMRQAPKWGNTLPKELARLLVHGLLHLAGYTHHQPRPKKIMESLENNYLMGSN